MKRWHIIVTVIALVFFLLSVGPLDGQVGDLESRLKSDPDNREILLNLGRYFHNLGSENKGGDAVNKADKYLSRLLELDQENALAMVYYGSVQTMKARDAGEPEEALGHLENGFSRMDKAVLFAPDNPEVRLVRAINSLNIPDQFGRLSVALEDFRALDGMDQKMLAARGKDFLTKIYFFHGSALQRTGNRPEAIVKFRRVLETAPGSPYAEMAQKQLALLEKNQ